eukprot:comp16214_c2_seq1/m.13886 comp16214_c2_seq1/g.13886  ORF comp16214_c2_seq1/g.13886 comp16214_c2_seq1/m.13886 type:complete len:108 (-) comp16214_c2_seq1:148-471(-)
MHNYHQTTNHIPLSNFHQTAILKSPNRSRPPPLKRLRSDPPHTQIKKSNSQPSEEGETERYRHIPAGHGAIKRSLSSDSTPQQTENPSPRFTPGTFKAPASSPRQNP